MVEARARPADCKSIRALDWTWMADSDFERHLDQLLQSVLPSAEQLPTLL